MSDSDMASNRGTNERKSYRPRKGKDQAEREELSLTRSLREGTASAPAAPGCQENRPSEAEAIPEGEGSKPKRQSADRGQSRLGEPGSRPTARGAQRRERYTRKEGTKLNNRPRHQPQPAEKRVGDERHPRPLTRDHEEPWRERRVTQR